MERRTGSGTAGGWFGENLRVTGAATTDAVIGTRWRIGTTELEVTEPRVPCGTFAHWTGEPQWVKRFTGRADVGAYLRVLTPGRLQAGDPVQIVSVPEHGVTVRDVFTGADPAGCAHCWPPPAISRTGRPPASASS